MLVKTYASAGTEDRLYDQEYELLEAVGHDLTVAGAYLLGRDAAQIASNEAAQQVRELLSSVQHMDRLLSQIIGNATFQERAQIVEDILQRFRLGFLEGENSAL